MDKEWQSPAGPDLIRWAAAVKFRIKILQNRACRFWLLTLECKL